MPAETKLHDKRQNVKKGFSKQTPTSLTAEEGQVGFI